MPEFQIGRGHDGPARVGILRLGNNEYPTPLLLGDVASGIPLISPSKNATGIVSLPSLARAPEPSPRLESEDKLVLLPSLIGTSPLGTEFAKRLVLKQLQLIEYSEGIITPSQAILRIPSSLALDELLELIPHAQKKGLRAAALTIGSTRGNYDLSSLFLRSKLPADWLVIALGRIHPSQIPLLYYLGIDAFDTGMATQAAAQSLRLWRLGSEYISSESSTRYCPCRACTDTIEVHGELSRLSAERIADTLRRHNLSFYESVLSECIHAQKAGSLRWLVEAMTHYSPTAVSLLRHINTQLYGFLEEFTPTTGRNQVLLLGPESYDAPAIKRFRERVAVRYTPPEEKRLVLLLPCSARKPYSDSSSHRRFNRAIESALAQYRRGVAEVILTSPIGLVPRELERMYPAAHYDIPVTGDWDAEEITIAADALTALLAKFGGETVVVTHVSGGYQDCVKAAEEQISQSIIYTTAGASPTSRNSLRELQQTLSDMQELVPLERGKPLLLRDTVRATADYQFGKGAGDLLVPEEARLRGKVYGSIVCQIDKKQVCTFVGETGAISLTLHGGEVLSGMKPNWVSFEGTELRGGSLFAVGIERADEQIRPGDEVIVLDSDGAIIGVGRSEMSGREMCELNRGRAVTLRHKRGSGQ